MDVPCPGSQSVNAFPHLLFHLDLLPEFHSLSSFPISQFPLSSLISPLSVSLTPNINIPFLPRLSRVGSLDWLKITVVLHSVLIAHPVACANLEIPA